MLRLCYKGKEPIAETVLIRALLKNLEQSGVFELDIRDWRRKKNNKTLKDFKEFFNLANKDRLEKATSASMGYANQAAGDNNTPPGTPSKNKDDEANTVTPLKYCWSHGFNTSHPGRMCKRKAKGHQDEATVDSMKGGNNMIQRKRNEKPVYVREKPKGKQEQSRS
jgi:hypothetical protein